MGFEHASADRTRWIRKILIGVMLMTGLLPGIAAAEWGLNFQRPVTEIAHIEFDLHMLIMKICAVIFVVVFSVMFYSMFKHTKAKGHQAAKFSHSTKAEVIWTIIPALILVVMAVPSTYALLKMEDTTNSDMTLKITGYQWLWHYEYMDHGVELYSSLSTPRAQIEGREPKGDDLLVA